jgi:trimeric autotransporter adhesin
MAGGSALTLTVTGTGFLSTSVVQVNSTTETTTYVSATQLTATVPAGQLASGAQLAVAVLNGLVSSGSGTPINLEVDNPAPTITSISPSSEALGASATTVMVTGTGFVPTTVIKINGTSQMTTVTSSTQVSVALPVADLSVAGTLSLTAVNPTPGGGTSSAAPLTVLIPVTPPTPVLTPVINEVFPNQFLTGSQSSTITVFGTNLNSGSVVQWNGTPLATTNFGLSLSAVVPSTLLTTAGTANITVTNSGATPPTSQAVTVTISNPPSPTLTSLSPNAGPINTATSVTLFGSGFTSGSTVAVNGVQVNSTFVDSNELTLTLPASSVALPGNLNVTVTTPAPGGGTTAALTYTAYVAIQNNDIAYNAADSLLYATVPGGAASMGNSVVGIDPATGNVMRQIFVGSNPNKLAISTDGKQLFVGLDGAGAVAQVDLTKGSVVNQFSLGSGTGVSSPNTAAYLAAVPGLPNSVAVATGSNFGSGAVAIYDSGVARGSSLTTYGAGPLSFGSSSSILYLAGSSLVELAVDPTAGINATPTATLATSTFGINSLQYDNGQLYLSTGAVYNTTTNTLAATLFSSPTVAANGPVVSDSTLGTVFIAESSFNAEVLAFNESSFTSTGSIPVSGGQIGSTSFQKIVRWGQNGLALTSPASFDSSLNQIFILQSPVVKNLSASPADLAVSLNAPATATTGTAVSWVATVSNNGPNPAQGALLAMNLDSSLIINSVTASQGACGNGTSFTCDLGAMANGASVTVTISATPTNSGTLAGVASVSSTSTDPTLTNNQATSSTTSSGGLFGALPTLSALSPNLVQAGTADFTLTVTGSGFNADSVVNLGTSALATTYVSATQLTASVTAAEVATYGWMPITVSNPSPGGGVSQILPLTIYAVVNVPTSNILFDPFAQLLYATVPGTATNLTGNSVVSIDPMTGTVGTPVPVGSEPTVMAETGDGNYLYIGLSGAHSLVQFNLLTQTVSPLIALPLPSNEGSNNTATALAVLPGSDTTLAVDFSGLEGIFDSSTGTFGSSFANGNSPSFADASDLYTFDEFGQFDRYTIDPINGATKVDSTSLAGLSGSPGGFQLANGLVYGVSGGIANPSPTPPNTPVQVATLPLFTFSSLPEDTSAVANVADPSLQKEFLMLQNLGGNPPNSLVRYDLNSYLAESVLNIPASASSPTIESSWSVLRWGQNGLALLSSGGISLSSAPPANMLILLQGPFVTPQMLQSNGTAPVLTSSSATTLTHGSGNTLLTLSGSNFLPGVAVTWNGSYRTTTVVSPTQVTVAIPASDLTATGTAALVATNPGSPASGSLQITIN